jgi:catechol 2,3-dioxygenase-like lactoylglutathione lyase family enzyme
MPTLTRVDLPALRALVPMLHVASVARSVAFYERLGFEVANAFTPPGEAEPSFASLRSGGASLMVVRAGAPIDPTQQAVILTLYCGDVPAFHVALGHAGVAVEPITYPAERPGGRFRLTDPDGYDLAVTHA